MKPDRRELCVLRISPDVLDISNAIISDRNAAVRIRRFAPAYSGLVVIDKELVFAEFWHHDDPIAKKRHRAIKCAEILIPDKVPPVYITGAYVSCSATAARVNEIAPQLAVVINGHLFFYEGP